MIRKVIAVIILIIASIHIANAQAVSYGYDECGNRISRVLSSSHVKTRDTISDINVPYKDLSSIVKITTDSKIGTATVIIDGFKQSDKCSIDMYNTTGVKLFNLSVDSPSTLIDLRPYPDGVYIIYVNLNDNYDTWKITKACK